MPAIGNRNTDDDVWKILAYVRTLAAAAPTDPPRGNAENGERIFRANCDSCHLVNGRGGRLGPDLSRVGAARTRAALTRQIRGAVEGFRPGYEPVTLTTRGGRTIHGVKKNEDLFSVQIMDTGERIQGYLKEDMRDGDRRQAVGHAAVRHRTVDRECRRRPDRVSVHAARRQHAAPDPRTIDKPLQQACGGPPSGDRHAPTRSSLRGRRGRRRARCRPRRAAAAAGPVTAQEIAAGLPADGSRWITFGGAYNNHRHSPLTQITPENVNRLVPQWMFQTDTLGAFETTTLFRDNVLYVTGPQNLAWAIDARTGRQIWRYRRELPPQGTLTACCGLVNKGFGMLGDRLFMVTLDAHLLALDTRTGAVVWDATMADYTKGYASTIAPLVVKDKVIVGIAGGEYGIRGFIDAYDAQTGKRAWRFYTIPGPGEPGNETWAGTRGEPAAPACGSLAHTTPS